MEMQNTEIKCVHCGHVRAIRSSVPLRQTLTLTCDSCGGETIVDVKKGNPPKKKGWQEKENLENGCWKAIFVENDTDFCVIKKEGAVTFLMEEKWSIGIRKVTMDRREADGMIDILNAALQTP